VILPLLLLLVQAEPGSTPSPPKGPTFCAEWVRQSTEGFDRLTLFRDRTLVWKTHRGEQEDLKRKTLEAGEVQYYCALFARSDFWEIPSDSRTGLAGELSSQSAVTLARQDGSRKTIRFDDLSAHTAASSELRAALDGLRTLFVSPLAPASRFSVDSLPPGTLLKRFDGRVFRVARVQKDTGFVELVGVTDPYGQFLKIDELRYQFAPPEPAP
jgi:hypothetical protein